MTALLKAMGVMVWSLAAVGLLFVGGVIGIRALRTVPAEHRSGELPAPVTPPTAGTAPLQPSEASTIKFTGSAESLPLLPAGPHQPDLPDNENGRAKLREAVARRNVAGIIRYGVQLDEAGLARPEDLSNVAIAYFTIGDCPQTLRWIGKTTDALAGGQPDPALIRAQAGCGVGGIAAAPPRVTGSGPSGEHAIRIGELFYGFNDYSRAIDFLRKGLQAGGLRHPDEAYVYLGRSYLALGDYADACAAFDGLKRVEGIDPRVYKLWTLYADMQCMAPRPR